MATATLYQSQNMFSPTIWYGSVSSYSNSHITISAGTRFATYYGSFSFNSYGLTGGTITSYQEYYNGSISYTVSGLSLDALTVNSYLNNGNALGLQSYALAGNDTINGSTGSDQLSGWTDDDTLNGQAGNDSLNGGAGNDAINGGEGTDYAYYSGSSSAYTVTALAGGYRISGPGDGTDTLTSIEYLVFSDRTIAPGMLLAPDLSGNNSIVAKAGSESIDGGGGIDTVQYGSAKANFAITKVASGYVVTDKIGTGGSDSLQNVERLQFSDTNVALDSDGANSAGGIYRLYQATFNRLPDLSGIGYWIAQADAGESAIEMAEDFTWSQEFQQLYGVATIDNYLTGNNIGNVVNGFYQNVLHRAPDQGGLTYYTAVIQSHEKTVGRVLAEISDSNENYTATIGQIQNGIDYTPWHG